MCRNKETRVTRLQKSLITNFTGTDWDYSTGMNSCCLNLDMSTLCVHGAVCATMSAL